MLEQRITVLLELGALMAVSGVLHGKLVQAELPLHAGPSVDGKWRGFTVGAALIRQAR